MNPANALAVGMALGLVFGTTLGLALVPGLQAIGAERRRLRAYGWSIAGMRLRWWETNTRFRARVDRVIRGWR